MGLKRPVRLKTPHLRWHERLRTWDRSGRALDGAGLITLGRLEK